MSECFQKLFPISNYSSILLRGKQLKGLLDSIYKAKVYHGKHLEPYKYNPFQGRVNVRLICGLIQGFVIGHTKGPV